MSKTTDSAPAMGQKPKDVGWAASTYFAEGLPYSVVHQVGGQQYLTAVGVAPELVGLASLLHLPWNVKFLWAPLVDSRASAKRWMVGALVALAAATAVMGLAAAHWGSSAVLVVLVLAAIFAATNDIAIDAYYMRSLDKPRQAELSGVRIGAYRAALLVGSGPIVALAGMTSFSLAFLALSGILLALALLHGAYLTPDARPVEARVSPLQTAKQAAKTLFSKPGIVPLLALLLCYRAGDALLFAMNAKFLASLGLDTTMRGVVNGTAGTIASISGSLVGGLVIARVGFRRAFVPITVGQALALPLYSLVALVQPSLLWVACAVVVEQFVAGVGTAAFMVFIMRMCDGPEKATMFAFASSIMSLAVTAAGAASGFLYVALGAPVFFLVAFGAALPGVVLSAVVRKRLGS